MRRCKTLAIIPARGGSRSVPQKNIHPLAGRPLIAHTIEAAQASELLHRFIVSTDDVEIAQVARELGAEVPFIRPSELAQDDTQDLPVFVHALRWLEQNEDYTPDIVLNLRPTSPLRRANDIDGAIRLLIETEADSVKSVCTATQHPHKMWYLQDTNLVPYLNTPFRLSRGPDVPRQDLEQVYLQNGAVDVTWRSVILKQGKLIGERVRGYVMSEIDSVDIDFIWDFAIAEVMLALRTEHTENDDQ